MSTGKSITLSQQPLNLLTILFTDFSLFGGADSLTEGRSPRRTFPSNTNKHETLSLLPPQDPKDFLWLHTEEPHRSRRLEIMKKHPQVTKLMGYEPLTKYIVFLVVSLQIAIGIFFAKYYQIKWNSWIFIGVAYVIGGTANHNLFLAIHEITHNLAFPRVWQNKALAVFANLPIGIPYAAAFKVGLCSLFTEMRRVDMLNRLEIPYRTSQIPRPRRY